MAATFNRRNKEGLQGIFEKRLAWIVPKLFSMELISSEARDVALNPSTASSIRAAMLFEALEGAIVSYQDLLLFVHVLLTSRIDGADRRFVEEVLTSIPSGADTTDISRRVSFSDTSTLPPTHRRRISDPMLVTPKPLTVEAISAPPPHLPISDSTS